MEQVKICGEKGKKIIPGSNQVKTENWGDAEPSQ